MDFKSSSIVMSQQNNDLAYGGYYEAERGDGSRGLSDTFKKILGHGSSNQQGYGQYQVYFIYQTWMNFN